MHFLDESAIQMIPLVKRAESRLPTPSPSREKRPRQSKAAKRPASAKASSQKKPAARTRSRKNDDLANGDGSEDSKLQAIALKT